MTGRPARRRDAARARQVLTETGSANGHAPAEAPAAPRGRLPRTVRPARTTRRRARVPSRIAIGALVVLAAVGVKATVAPRAAWVRAAVVPATERSVERV